MVVSWKYGASYVRYWQSAANTRTVGALTFLIMQKLVEEAETEYDKIWCIGHSLGAQMCGHAGNRQSKTLGRITGKT